MNNALQSYARKNLKDGLAKLPDANQLLFKRMYAHGDLALPIDEVVDLMEEEKLDWAMQQVDRTIAKLVAKENNGNKTV